MKTKHMRILLVVIALVCFGVALSYPVTEYLQEKQTENTMDMLSSLREAGRQSAAETQAPQAETQAPEAEEKPDAPADTDVPAKETTQASAAASVTDAPEAVATAAQAQETEEAAPTGAPADAGETAPAATANAGNDGQEAVVTPAPEVTPTPSPSPEPTPTVNRWVNTGAKTWAQLEKVALDESKILPQYQELYAMNNDMVGWLTIPGTRIDYPVMQREDEEYYLSHDFFHKDNANGLLILDANCDPYTPSYNLVVSGHNRKNDTMFSKLNEYYADKRHWQAHPHIQFDTLMEERTYVVFAAFYSGVYEDDEEGFRYNADIQYSVDFNLWIRQVNENKLYDTGVDVQFGDELLTLTTCNSSRRKNGRFVVVCRRVREGEELIEAK